MKRLFPNNMKAIFFLLALLLALISTATLSFRAVTLQYSSKDDDLDNPQYYNPHQHHDANNSSTTTAVDDADADISARLLTTPNTSRDQPMIVPNVQQQQQQQQQVILNIRNITNDKLSANNTSNTVNDTFNKLDDGQEILNRYMNSLAKDFRLQLNRSDSNESISSPTPLLNLYIHIGPHKTGTTTLQDTFAKYGHRLREQDSMVYLGKINKEYVHEYAYENERIRPLDMSWIKEYHPTKANQTKLDLQSKLEECYANQQHAIMSNEEFSNVHEYGDNIARFLQMIHELTDGKFQVHVLMVYRRFADWFTSKYNYDMSARKFDWDEHLLITKDEQKQRQRRRRKQMLKNELTNAQRYAMDLEDLQRLPVQAQHPIVIRERTKTTREFLNLPPGQYPYQRAWEVYTTTTTLPATNHSTDANSNEVTTNVAVAPANPWKMHWVDMYHWKSSRLLSDDNDNTTYEGQLALDVLCHVMEPAQHTCRYLAQQEVLRETLKRQKEKELHHQHQLTLLERNKLERSNQQQHFAEYELMGMYLRYDVDSSGIPNLTQGLRRKSVYWAIQNAWSEWTQSRQNVKELPWSLRSQWKSPQHRFVTMEYTDDNNNDGNETITILDRPIVNKTALQEAFRRKELIDFINNATIPLECPTKEEYDQIWQITLAGEFFLHQINNDESSTVKTTTTSVEWLRQEHEKAIASHKYCHVDLDVIHLPGASSWLQLIAPALQYMQWENQQMINTTLYPNSTTSTAAAKQRTSPIKHWPKYASYKPW